MDPSHQEMIDQMASSDVSFGTSGDGVDRASVWLLIRLTPEEVEKAKVKWAGAPCWKIGAAAIANKAIKDALSKA
jgi:hypothetical protein